MLFRSSVMQERTAELRGHSLKITKESLSELGLTNTMYHSPETGLRKKRGLIHIKVRISLIDRILILGFGMKGQGNKNL